MLIRVVIGLFAAFFAVPGAAQVRWAPVTSLTVDQEDEQPLVPQQQQTPLDSNQAGRSARSSAGHVGQRQTRETTAAAAGIRPMARITNRIQNRVQTRIRNRIDRDYDPQINAVDPFAVAEEQTRTGGRPR